MENKTKEEEKEREGGLEEGKDNDVVMGASASAAVGTPGVAPNAAGTTATAADDTEESMDDNEIDRWAESVVLTPPATIASSAAPTMTNTPASTVPRREARTEAEVKEEGAEEESTFSERQEFRFSWLMKNQTEERKG